MKQYVKNPIPIYAVKVEKENREEIIELLNSGTTNWEPVEEDGQVVGFYVHSWEGIEPVYFDPKRNADKDHTDGGYVWIIKGIKGECYPCADDVFQLSYTEYRQ